MSHTRANTNTLVQFWLTGMSAKLEKQLAKLLKKARTHLKKGQLDKALVVYREMCELSRYDEELWNTRAELAQQLGEVGDTVDSYFHLADMYARSGRHADAAGMVKRVLAIDPKHGGARAFTRMLRAYFEEPAAPVVPERPAPRAEAYDEPEPEFDGTGGVDWSPAHDAIADEPDDLQPVLELEAIEPDEEELSYQTATDLSTDAPTDEADTVLRGEPIRKPPSLPRSPAPSPAMARAMTEEDEPVATTQVRPAREAEMRRETEEVPAIEPNAMGEADDVLPEAAGDDDSGPIPARIKAEWRSARPKTGGGEHRISHHSAQLAVADVIDVSAQDPGDVPEPEVEMDIVEAVAETIPISPLLSELDSDLVKFLIDNSRLRHKAAGQTVFKAGDTGANLYLILRGEVVVEKPGDSTQRVATLRPGAFFGEMALLTDAARSATVRAVSQLSLLDIPRDTIRAIVEKQGRVRKLLMRFFRARMVGSLMVSSDLFKPFSVEDRRKLVTRFRLRELPPGQVVLEQGTRSDGLYLVLAGSVEVYMPENDIVLSELGSGDVFGEISLLEDADTAASVRAKTRGWVLRLPRDDFKELIASYPKVLERLDLIARERKAHNAAVLARMQSA